MKPVEDRQLRSQFKERIGAQERLVLSHVQYQAGRLFVSAGITQLTLPLLLPLLIHCVSQETRKTFAGYRKFFITTAQVEC